ncbi:LRR receptor-like serine/threonine-protein kinase GSO1, partial [Tanacetum coccineum]
MARIPWKDNAFVDKSFAREVNTIGQIKHMQLAKLLGYWSNREAGFDLLIYGEPENIKKRKSLDWETRLKIVVGLAQGSYCYIAPGTWNLQRLG